MFRKPLLFNGQIHFFSYHHFDEGGNFHRLCFHGFDGLTFSQNRHPVRDFHDLVELVSDDHYCASLLFHITDDPEQLFDLLRSQDRRRLVHDQNFCPSV